MTVWSIIPLVTCSAYLVLLIFALQQAHNRANRMFAVYLGIAAFWSFTAFMLHMDGVPASQTLFWNQMLVVALVGTLIAYYHFVRAYTNKPGGIWLYAGYVLLAVITALSFTGNIVEYSYVENGVLVHELGMSLYVIMTISLTYTAAVLYQFIRKYRTSTDPIERNRTMYLITGWVMLAILTMTNAFPKAAQLPLDHIGSLINALIISYAISKFPVAQYKVGFAPGAVASVIVFRCDRGICWHCNDWLHFHRGPV